MCGISGLWWPFGQEEHSACQLIGAMNARQRHRGPDAEGFWADSAAGIALGHRRLAILDPTETGAQPMTSGCGRYVITFNGEIYNHQHLRKRLELEARAPPWRGHSDTETLLAAISAWGLDAALHACAGMFALGLWDRHERTLILARDAVGEKPLYYGRVGNAFAFASELGALRILPGFDRTIDPAAAAGLLSYLYVPDPLSIHPGINKLLPGHTVRIAGGVAEESRPWWSLDATIRDNAARRRSGAIQNPVDGLAEVLGEVVESHMLSDVPIGSFLSGGIDSSLVTALMQARSGMRVRTYAIGFDDPRLNELEHARAVAGHLGTDHTEMILTESEAIELAHEMPRHFSEPFADSSQLPTLFLARLARQDITVALTGDGGDEMFGGYSRHWQTPRQWRTLEFLPGWSRRAIGRVGARLADNLDHDGSWASAILNLPGMPANLAGRLPRIARLIGLADNPTLFNAELNRVAGDGQTWLAADLRRDLRVPFPRTLDSALLNQLGKARWMMGNDALGYLPGDILVKVDRATMATSLEARAPFLDRRLIEYAWSLPDSVFFEGQSGKKVVRELLYRYVPKPIVDRPKQGFAIPLDRWLRGPLREWMHDLLGKRAIEKVGLLESF